MSSVYVITEACVDVKDQSCVVVCPVDCIETSDDDRMCFIDPDRCTGCDLCLGACPVGAIATEERVPAVSGPSVAINRLWFSDRDSARQLLDDHLAGS